MSRGLTQSLQLQCNGNNQITLVWYLVHLYSETYTDIQLAEWANSADRPHVAGNNEQQLSDKKECCIKKLTKTGLYSRNHQILCILLTIRGPCIVIYFYTKTNQMHQCIKFILFWNDTLYVSDSLSVRHHKLKTVHAATGICQTDTAVCLLASSICLTYACCCMYSLELVITDGKTVWNV